MTGLHWFGIVQSVYEERTRDWTEFYGNLLGFTPLPGGKYFGILPKGTLLESPCHKFYLQLIEPPPGAEDIEWEERLLRVGLGAPDVIVMRKTSSGDSSSDNGDDATDDGDSSSGLGSLVRHTGRVKVTPYIEAQQVVTAELSPGNEVLTYSTVAAGLEANLNGRNAQAGVAVRYERRFGWGSNKISDSDVVSGVARANVALVPRTLFLMPPCQVRLSGKPPSVN